MSAEKPSVASSVAPAASETSIGPALASDAPAIAAIGAKTFTETFGHVTPKADLEVFFRETYSTEAILAELKDPKKSTYVARLNPSNDVVGFIQLERGKTDPSLEGKAEELVVLQKLYVDRAAQGKGVGGKLCSVVEEQARAEGFKQIWLTVYEDHPMAQKMYQRRGYRKTGETQFPAGSCIHNDWVYTKYL